jgi:hypothetical protein
MILHQILELIGIFLGGVSSQRTLFSQTIEVTVSFRGDHDKKIPRVSVFGQFTEGHLSGFPPAIGKSSKRSPGTPPGRVGV